MIMVPIRIRNRIRSFVLVVSEHIKKETPDYSRDLNIPPVQYYFDSKFFKLAYVKTFIGANKEQLSRINRIMLRPMGIVLDDDPTETFRYILEDYIDYMIHVCAESENPEEEFIVLWDAFNNDFFAESFSVSLRAILKNFYYHGGTGMENISSFNGVKMRYLDTLEERRRMSWSTGNAHRHYEYSPPENASIITIGWDGKTSTNIYSTALQSSDTMQLVTLAMRGLVRGMPYFTDIRVIGLGSFSSSEDFAFLHIAGNDWLKRFPSATLNHPEDWFLNNQLKKISARDYTSFIFIESFLNQGLVVEEPDLSTSPSHRIEQEMQLMDALVKITFAYNALMPDFSYNSVNADMRVNYLPELLAQSGQNKVYVSGLLKNLYLIRNKVAHGHYEEAKALLYSNYTSLKQFHQAIQGLGYVMRKLIALALVNPDFEDLMISWKRTNSPSEVPAFISPYTE